MNQPKTPYPLRIPQDLREWFQQRAAENSRSLQGELIHRLIESKRKDEGRGVEA